MRSNLDTGSYFYQALAQIATHQARFAVGRAHTSHSRVPADSVEMALIREDHSVATTIHIIAQNVAAAMVLEFTAVAQAPIKARFIDECCALKVC
jgi:hypothetical protein